jgi:hypothetical protein
MVVLTKEAGTERGEQRILPRLGSRFLPGARHFDPQNARGFRISVFEFLSELGPRSSVFGLRSSVFGLRSSVWR